MIGFELANDTRNMIFEQLKASQLDTTIYQDPFSDETRKLRRNLLAASFFCFLIITLKLPISSFLGVNTGGNVPFEKVAGILLLISSYFLVSFLLNAFIELKVWKNKREVIIIEPYLHLVMDFDNTFSGFTHLLSQAAAYHKSPDSVTLLEGEEIRLRRLIQNPDESVLEQLKMVNSVCTSMKKNSSDALNHISTISKSMEGLLRDIYPLISLINVRARGFKRLQTRLILRYANLYIMDLFLPVFLFLWIFTKSYPGLLSVLSEIRS